MNNKLLISIVFSILLLVTLGCSSEKKKEELKDNVEIDTIDGISFPKNESELRYLIDEKFEDVQLDRIINLNDINISKIKELEYFFYKIRPNFVTVVKIDSWDFSNISKLKSFISKSKNLIFIGGDYFFENLKVLQSNFINRSSNIKFENLKRIEFSKLQTINSNGKHAKNSRNYNSHNSFINSSNDIHFSNIDSISFTHLFVIYAFINESKNIYFNDINSFDFRNLIMLIGGTFILSSQHIYFKNINDFDIINMTIFDNFFAHSDNIDFGPINKFTYSNFINIKNKLKSVYLDHFPKSTYPNIVINVKNFDKDVIESIKTDEDSRRYPKFDRYFQ